MTKIKMLDKFGMLLMQCVRDSSINSLIAILEGNAKAPSSQMLSKRIDDVSFSSTQKEIIKQLITESVDETVHNFLWMLEETETLNLRWQEDEQRPISITLSSDGLSGELYTEDGWIYRFSKHGKK